MLVMNMITYLRFLLCIIVTFLILVFANKNEKRYGKIVSILKIAIIGGIITSVMAPESLKSVYFNVINDKLSSYPSIKPLCDLLFHDYNDIIEYPLLSFLISSSYIIVYYLTVLIRKLIVLFLDLFEKNIRKRIAFRSRLNTDEKKICKILVERMRKIDSSGWIVFKDENDSDKDLYVPVNAEIQRLPKERKRKKHGGAVSKDTSLIGMLKQIQNRKKVILVLGLPGSGKSVSMRRYCMEALSNPSNTGVIPIYINLKKWCNAWKSDTGPTIDDLAIFTRETVERDLDFIFDEERQGIMELYDKMFSAKRFYYVFDSFDEIPCFMGTNEQPNMIKFRRKVISETIYKFCKESGNGGIITSRIYRDTTTDIKLDALIIVEPLNFAKIRKIMKNYLPDNELRIAVEEKIYGRREILISNCKNPFFLSLLLHFIRRREEAVLPNNNKEIYEDYLRNSLDMDDVTGLREQLGLSTDSVYDFAKKLAIEMQESQEYGSVFPIANLSDDYGPKKDIIKVLVKAKICRYEENEGNEMITFVHRRFQEFYLVENWGKNKSFTKEEYKEIILDDGVLRDALALYCEIADFDISKDAADYCMSSIRENFKHNSRIDKDSLKLINALFFMRDALGNRQDIIYIYRDKLERYIHSAVNTHTDFVVVLSILKCMPLFSQQFMQKMVVRVNYLYNNLMLNYFMVKQCRLFCDELSRGTEKVFLETIYRMPFRRDDYSELKFSLSLWDSLRYVKQFNVSQKISELALLCCIPISWVSAFLLILSNCWKNYYGWMFWGVYNTALIILALIIGNLPWFINKMSKNGNHNSIMLWLWYCTKSTFVSSIPLIIMLLGVFLVPWPLVIINLKAFFVWIAPIIKGVSLMEADLAQHPITVLIVSYGVLGICILNSNKDIIVKLKKSHKSKKTFKTVKKDLLKHGQVERSIFCEKMEKMPDSRYRMDYLYLILKEMLLFKGEWPNGECPKYNDKYVDMCVSLIEYKSITNE